MSRKGLDNSRNAYEQAQTQIKRDEATVAQLETALHAAEINLGDTEIVSPIDGTIVSRSVEPGQTVAAGSETPPLFLVTADLTVVHVDAKAGEKDIVEVKPGGNASFTVEAYPNRRFAGEVTQVRPLPQTIQNVATYNIVISAPNPERLLEPGMMATISIVVDRRDDVIRAPNRALRYLPRDLAVPNGSGGPRVPPDRSSQLWILRDGKPIAITVQLGLDDGANTEIVEGDLQAGDELIISESGGV
jgi:HlyD family secretion protein